MPIDGSAAAELTKAGYRLYRRSDFVRVRGDMLFIVSRQGVKSDLYWWYATYPLVLPKLWPSMGWPPAAGRVPEAKGAIVRSDESQQLMQDLLVSAVLPRLSPIKSLEALAAAYDAAGSVSRYPQAFCLLAMGQLEPGRAVLKQIDLGRLLAEERACVTKLLATSEAQAVAAILDANRRDNIRHLRLQRFLDDA